MRSICKLVCGIDFPRLALVNGGARGIVRGLEIGGQLPLQIAFDGLALEIALRPDETERKNSGDQNNNSSRISKIQIRRAAKQSAREKDDEQNQAAG